MSEGLPFHELSCPACGSTQFKVGQFTWNTQDYDAENDDWGDSKNSYEGDIAIDVQCAACEFDCTALAVIHGYDITHEHGLRRHVPPREIVKMPSPIRLLGQNGAIRKAYWRLNGNDLEFWLGTPQERFPHLTIAVSNSQGWLTQLMEMVLDVEAARTDELRDNGNHRRMMDRWGANAILGVGHLDAGKDLLCQPTIEETGEYAFSDDRTKVTCPACLSIVEEALRDSPPLDDADK